MALKATIFKVDLSVADMGRNVYAVFPLTLARHPSENDARMMVRLLAFMLFAEGLIVTQRVEMYIRARRVLAGGTDSHVEVAA